MIRISSRPGEINAALAALVAEQAEVARKLEGLAYVAPELWPKAPMAIITAGRVEWTWPNGRVAASWHLGSEPMLCLYSVNGQACDGGLRGADAASHLTVFPTVANFLFAYLRDLPSGHGLIGRKGEHR